MKNLSFIFWVIYSVFFYYLLSLNNTVYSQMNSGTFERISIKDGLCHSTISYIIQDRKGFMWFATYNGLNRYDGLTFTVYRNIINDSTSLIHNEITFLCEDDEGNIWVVNKEIGGLNKFNPKIEKFTRYTHNPDDSTSISSNLVYHFLQDKSGNLWVCTKNALNLIITKKINNEISTVFKRFYYNTSNRSSFTRMYEDRDGKLLLFAEDLYYFDKESSKIIKTNTALASPDIDDMYIHSVCADKHENLWIGTNTTGIIKLNYNKHTKSYQKVSLGKVNVTPKNRNYLLIDHKDRIWIGTESQGLFQYDEKENSLINFVPNEVDLNTISDNTIYSLYIDRSGILWIGTFSQGLCKYDLYKKQFHYFKAVTGDNNTLSGNIISCIHSTRPNELWVGNDLNDGLNRFIFENNNVSKIIHYRNDPNNINTIGGNNILCLVQRKNGDVWEGSAGGTISIIKPEKPETNEQPIIKTFTHIGWSFSIYEDSNETIWVGSWGGGLARYHKGDSCVYFNHDPQNPKSLCDNIIWAITEDNAGNIWIGGRGRGLSILPVKEKDKLNPEFINYKHEEKNPKSLSNNLITVFCQDKQGTMWIGTAGGLNKVIKADNNFNDLSVNEKLGFFSYHVKNGLPNEHINGIVEDNNRNLWISTFDGLSKFDILKDSFINYDERDGLQSNEFWHNAYFKDQEGRIYFGGQNGLNFFYPDSIKSNPFLPQVVFTDMKIFNKSVSIGEKVNGNIILSKTIHETSEIVLSYKDNIFSLEFAALHYALPERNKYMYKMEGFDKDWVKTSAKRNFATYTNLHAGKYTFKVKASNNDGLWNKEETSMKIIILPPWWKNLFFKIFFILLILALATNFYYYRITNLKKQKIYLEKEVKKRTKEILEKNKTLEEQTYILNETNILLKERQHKIEDQALELSAQKEELEMAFNSLHETNTLLEERQQQIEEQSAELKAQTEKLNEKNKKLKTLNATKDKFFSIIAHDLKNPFNSIMGFAELLLTKFDKLAEGKKRQYAEIIYNSSLRIFKLLENLLQWARSQTNSIDFNPEEFDLNEMIHTNLELLKNSLKEKQITVNKKLAEKSNAYADRNMISTVVRNLLTNAIKFTEKGEISIETESTGNFWKLSIKDTGIGIPKEKLNKLFDIGNLKSSTGTRGESGTGLGLIICKDFIKKNGGEIWAESEEGVGSSFIFTLPVK